MAIKSNVPVPPAIENESQCGSKDDRDNLSNRGGVARRRSASVASYLDGVC